ncbi:recombinase family protein [Planotetraspora sp. A-T 1434]|uniref:recombinase family protein n=1 Tax=Planotetraspora sp. A-T 1434 TaxID=2979219 RepID=UPI0021C155C8|nr:recombinase family protein [Planotetraspora sp. A-T 1434]MCT9932396.1 recombinase family protein [Planotetraspora sp. A-T 1434]
MLNQVQNAAIYCRLSYAPDGSLEKVERQEDDCRKLADRLAWPVDERYIFKDNSRSAWQRNRKRPGWDKLLEVIEAREVDAVLVYHGDRLIRQPWDLELLLKLADDRHLHLASVSGVRDLMSEDDRFILRIEAAQACKQSADTSRRVRRGWQSRAEAGRAVGGGKRPFGYGVPTGKLGRTGKPLYDTTQMVPGEAEILREAARRLIAGQTQGGVIRWMNERSTTSQGKPWVGKSLKNLLVSPRIAGLVEHHGTLHKAVWEPILTMEEWEDVKLVMRQSAQEHGYAGRERKYLLSGIAECSGCGKPMRTKPSGGRNRKDTRLYYCWNRECPAPVSRNVEHLDRYVAGRVVGRLGDPALMDELLAAEPSVAADIVALERRRDELKAKFAKLLDHPDLDPEVMAGQLTEANRRIQDLRSRHASNARQRLLARMAGITAEQWDETPLDVRAATVKALFRVVVLPATWRGPGFDPGSVHLEPVDG